MCCWGGGSLTLEFYIERRGIGMNVTSLCIGGLPESK